MEPDKHTDPADLDPRIVLAGAGVMTFLAGAYKGYCDSKGIGIELPSGLGSSFLLTGPAIMQAYMGSLWVMGHSRMNNLALDGIVGAACGGLKGGIEVTAGYGAGYLAGYITK
ncbi:MAG: hypothetical protein KKE20_01490 [Nanoarchaeota archaeon]|nr:hypothetical protein [Nanoarchaeota archaeon]